jgi:hypothetical protein
MPCWGPTPEKCRSRTLARPEIPLSENTVAQALVFNKDGSSIN